MEKHTEQQKNLINFVKELMTVGQLNIIAYQFRSALENYLEEHPKESLNTNFGTSKPKEFPIDCCKGTSYTFGKFLENQFNITDIFYCWGNNKILGTHGWLEYNGLIIDITIDQFEGIEDKTIVIEKDQSGFHKSFRNQELCKFSLREGHSFDTIANRIIPYFNNNQLIR